ncbi:hypothetical protein HY642_01920 [Candidatus Woesearchaeota archaeon]|nr:hypothetical protein [Candidatus Woesearchaeota archaeon]
MTLNIYYAHPVQNADQESRRVECFTGEVLRRYGSVFPTYIGQENVRERELELQQQGVNAFERDISWINDSDVMVADVTKGSNGIGMEIMYALMTRRIPVLALHAHMPHAEKQPWRMPMECAHPLLAKREYTNEQDLESHITQYLSTIRQGWKLYPNYVLFDSIDGAGKGVCIEALKDWALIKGLPHFDVTAMEASQNYIPTWQEVKQLKSGCRMLFVAQPSHAWIGKIVRDEIIKPDLPIPYTPESTAHAYGLDRDVKLKRLVMPALDEGVFVAQDRGLLTSMAYQPVQAEIEGYSRELFLGFVMGLPGNQQELNRAPGLIVIPQVAVDVAMQRLAGREKQDHARFETKPFQEKVAEVYRGDRIRQTYRRRGTQIADLEMSADFTREQTKQKTLEIWERYLCSTR